MCKSRQYDFRAEEVKRRVINCVDLVQEEALYHDDCRVRFTWYESRKDIVEEEAERVVKQAAKIILGQIRSAQFDVEEYPSQDQISSIKFGKEWVPGYLRLFIETLVKKGLKQSRIAQTIVNAVRPRRVHLLMSFLIGAVMKESGIEKALEGVYGKTTVPHILSGKAVSRALRGHFLIEAALVCKLMTPLIASGQENGDSCEEMDRPTF
eukprot:gene10571-19306_t